MKLITKEIEKRLAEHPLYSQDGKGKKAEIICKFFLANLTFYVLEGQKTDNDYEFYGIIDNANEYGSEYGYFNLSHLTPLRDRFGNTVERDLYFTAKTVGDCKEIRL